MMSSPLGEEDGASAQEGGDDASSTRSSDDGTHHSHSDATAEDDDAGSEVATDDDDDDDGVDSDSQSKLDLGSDDHDGDELQDHVADDENILQRNYESASENSDDEQQAKSAEAEGTSSSSSSVIKLGGPNGSNGIPAYALLVGMMDPDSKEIISIPITRLPTTLGKAHATKDPSFIGLKECSTNDDDPSTENGPKLSQSMCCIFYRDAHGGKLGLYRKGRKKENDPGDEQGENVIDPLDGMIYKPCENVTCDDDKSSSAPSPDDVIRLPSMESNAPLPKSGFFAIECTGRKIIVGGRVLKKGQVAMLKDGSPIKIASHCFYFLLPKTTSELSKPPPSIKVKLAMTQMKPEKVSSSSAVEKKESESVGGATEIDTLPPPPAKKPRKSEEFLVSSFDDKSDEQLLQLLSQKVTETSWDHEGQKLGSTLATRVCRAAARSPRIQAIVRDEGGVTQREIIDWMNDPSNVFADYERMMLGKIVEKSFMMSMGKAILRAGYAKNEYLSGRAFRWNLPEDVPLCPPSGDNNLSGGGFTSSNNNVKEEDVESASNQSSHSDDGEGTELSDGKAEKGSIDAIT